MTNWRFVVSLITADNDYQMEQAAAAQAAASKLGISVQILYADDDAITQSTQLLKIVQSDTSERPHAIIFEPVGGTAFPQVARAAVEAKIGWAVLNREADYIADLRKSAKVPVFSITSDHKEIGRIQGRQFGLFLPSGGSLLYIQGPSENSAARDRAAGMQITVPPQVHVISLRGRWTEESAQRAVESWLRLNVTKKVQVDVVGAQNDLMAMGARKAFEVISDSEARDKWLHLPFTGVDGLPKTGQAWVRSGKLAATVVVPTNTAEALTMMLEARQMGRPVPERSFTTPESYPPIESLAQMKPRVPTKA